MIVLIYVLTKRYLRIVRASGHVFNSEALSGNIFCLTFLVIGWYFMEEFSKNIRYLVFTCVLL